MMKYNESQKHKVINKGLSIQRESVAKRNKIKQNYPIEVFVIGGFYVVESQLNNIELCEH